MKVPADFSTGTQASTVTGIIFSLSDMEKSTHNGISGALKKAEN